MSVKETLLSIGKYLIIVLIGFGFGIYFEMSRYQAPEISIEIPDSILEENKTKVDSLESIIIESELLVKSLKDSLDTVKEIKVIEVSNVRELPIDEAAEFLTLKLREYYEDINK